MVRVRPWSRRGALTGAWAGVLVTALVALALGTFSHGAVADVGSAETSPGSLPEGASPDRRGGERARPEGERILSFESEVLVREDGVLRVTETIRVVATGEQIQRGIYRELPAQRKGAWGALVSTPFHVIEVQRNGEKEPHWIDDHGLLPRIYMGRNDRRLEPGEHTYRLVYETPRQLNFLQDRDELYWNVTGNGWTFPIDRVVAAVHLPEGAHGRVLSASGFTGRRGSLQRDLTATVETFGGTFVSTRAFLKEEGLSVVLTWPKGVVVPPPAAESLRQLQRDNPTLFLNVVGCLALLAFMGVYAFRNRPREGATWDFVLPTEAMFPVSPSVARFVTRGAFDGRCLAAALASAARKGAVKVAYEGGVYTVQILTRDLPGLSPDERAIVRALFPDQGPETVHLTKGSVILKEASSALKPLVEDLRKRYFKGRNIALLVTGWAMASMTVVNFVFEGWMPFVLLCVLLFGSLVVFMVVFGASGLVAWVRGVRQRRFEHRDLLQAFFFFLLAAGAGSLYILGVRFWLELISTPTVAALFLIFLMPVASSVLFLPPRTKEGLRILAWARALKVNMKRETRRLRELRLPQGSDHLRALTPYAIALGVDGSWMDHSWLKLPRSNESDDGDDDMGHPRSSAFSHGSELGSTWVASFSTSVDRSWSSSTRTSSSESSEGSSYSSSSGGSGGGRGGGGGGGW